MVDASSVDVTSGERPLVGPPLGPADTSTGGVRRSARGLGTRDGRRTVGVGGNAGGGARGGSGRRVGRAIIRRSIFSEADNLGTNNNESIDLVGPDVGPFESVVHSGQGGELAGGWLIGASVHDVDLTMEGIYLSHRSTN